MTTMSPGSALRARSKRAQSGAIGSTFRSARAAVGALVLLLALPITIGFDMLVPGYAEVVIHLLLALGTLVVGLSVFDLATPKWLSRISCGAACALAAIFFLQALGALPGNEALRSFAYSAAIGGWGEAVTVSIVMAWLIAVARTLRQGPTQMIGVLAALTDIGLSVWSVVGARVGDTPAELRLLFLLPVAWLLFVSTRRIEA
jgi:hypothetical protein